MGILFSLQYLKTHWINIAVQSLLTFVTFLLIRYKYKQKSTVLVLTKKAKRRLLKEFEPLPLVGAVQKPYKFKSVRANFSNYDVFNFGGRYKSEIKDTIREYGVGTCGPRGFYGTLDVHLELEKKLAEVFGKDGAILYSNHFTCIQSVIPIFCKSNNNIFVHRHASTAIHRGLKLSRSTVFYYDSFEDLEQQLEKENVPDKYLVCERLAMNTGELLDLKRLVEIKSKYGFRVILDESFTVPFMYQSPEEKELYEPIELIVGSLCHGYPTNGAFCIGSAEAIDYERLAGASYVFSASLPAYLCRAALCMINETIDYSKLRGKIAAAIKHIPGIVTNRSSPIVLVKNDDPKEKIERLRDHGFIVGQNENLIRLCLNENTEESDLIEIGKLIK